MKTSAITENMEIKKNIEYKIFKYLSDKYGPNGYNVHLEDIILINEDTGEEELPDAQYS